MGYQSLATALETGTVGGANGLSPVPVPAYLCDSDGRITYYNERAAELWGRHPMLGSDGDRYCGSFAMYAADGTPLPRELCFMADALRTGTTCDGLEIVIERPDGSRRRALAYAAAVRQQGEIVGASALLIDVTDHERPQDPASALRTTEAAFRGFFDTPAVGAVQVNSDGRFIRVNDRYCEITGYSREELLTMGPVDLTHPDDRGTDLDRLAKALADPAGAYHAEKRYVRKDGSEVWVLVAANFMRDGTGRPVQTAALAIDINERKRAEAALQHADRLKDDFLATLAHELRNPLGPLQHAVELLRGEDLADRERCRRVIERQLGYLTHLIDDLVDVSRIARDKLVIELKPVDLVGVLADAAEASRPVLEQHDQTLSSYAPGEPLYVEGDSVRLTQVFTNLLTNAAKFNERPGTVELRVVREGVHVVVAVVDRGIGIAAEDLERIFEKFYQSPRNGDHGGGGLGIGLALVRRLVDLHGGVVEARSAGPGRGSEFIVRLPSAARPTVSPDRTPAPIEQVCRRRVLVVDDNADAADLLAELLKVMGHDVAVAYGGIAGIEQALALNPDFVFLDIGMPEVDGLDTCRRLREAPLAKRPHIVAMTGWGRPEDRTRTEGAGFDGHLVKPVDRAALARLLAG